LQLNLTDAMIQEYRATGPSSSSASSYNPSPTLSYPERVSSAQFRFITSDDVNRQISPVSTLNDSIVVEAPGSMVAARPPVGVHIPHKKSSSSISSLPVPPRRTPTPSRLNLDHASHPSVSSQLSLASSYSPITYPAAAQPSLTPRKASSSPRTEDDRMRYSAASTVSSASGDLDVSEWLSRQNSRGTPNNQPMLSAVKPNFPSSMPSPDPTASAAARLRPLLLASVERTGSMILAEHYNRMYSPKGSLESTREEDM